MNTRLIVPTLLLALALAMAACAKSATGQGAATAAEQFPDLALKTPASVQDNAYLGTDPAAATFRLSDIKAPFLLVQVFSAYCPHCQAEAPHMVELYDMIQKAGLGEKLKILGVGPNNNDFEVKLFRDKYKVPFPLVPDPEMRALETLGNTPTPTYLILKLNGAGAPPSLLDKEIGRFTTADEFLALLRKTTGL